MKSSGMVSVIMTCHNEEGYIAQAVGSVLGQTAFDRVCEVLIVNDGSTDRSGDILEKLAAGNGKLRILTASGIGPSAARNLALAEAKGEFIAILDGDDVWTPGKLAAQLPVIESDPRIGLVYGDFHDFSKDDMSDRRLMRVRQFDAAMPDLLETFFVEGGPIIPSTTIIRAKVFETVEPFNTSLRLNEDAELFLRIAEQWRFQYVPGAHLFKRVHGRNLTARIDTQLPAAEFITAQFVQRNPKLKPYAPKRMARRYGRAGSDCLAKGERVRALGYLRRAILLDPFLWHLYAYVLLALFPKRLGVSLRNVVRDALRFRRPRSSS